MMKIEKGPFAGVEIPDNELSIIPNSDGSSTDWWPVANRTPVFLERFSPQDGWSIEVRREPGPFNLPDYRNSVGDQVTVQPTQLFVVALLKGGIVVNQASSLEIIDGSKAWERGETNARGRLYEAMGLPGSTRPYLHQLLGDRKESERPVSTAAGVSIIPIATPKIDPVAPSNSSPNAAPEVSAVEIPPTAPSEHSISDTPASQSAPAAQDKQKAPAGTNQRDTAARQPDTINANLLKQIEVQAKIKGIDVPALADNNAAKAFLRDLLTAKVA